MSESKKYKQKRYSEKIGQKTFFLNVKNNHFDYVSDRLIKDLKKNLAKHESDIDDNDYLKYLTIDFQKKELFAISEMKIIYAYKHFETHLKFMIKASYQEVNEGDLYRWKSVEDFLKSKNINLNEISNYSEICELRNLNNAIKHARNIIGKKTKNILEFKNKTKLKYTDLLKFYKRTEESSLSFLKSLSDEIDKDLYGFDIDRIDKNI